MLKYLILDAKPYIQIPSNDEGSTTVECKDLLSNVLGNKLKDLTDYDVVEVTEDYIARPDLISLAVYGNDMYADIICKINGLSNPFELNTGMKLIIPSINAIHNLIKKGEVSSIVESNDKISKATLSNQKPKNSTRSPAEQVIGDKNFIIDKEKRLVIY